MASKNLQEVFYHKRKKYLIKQTSEDFIYSSVAIYTSLYIFGIPLWHKRVYKGKQKATEEVERMRPLEILHWYNDTKQAFIEFDNEWSKWENASKDHAALKKAMRKEYKMEIGVETE